MRNIFKLFKKKNNVDEYNPYFGPKPTNGTFIFNNNFICFKGDSSSIAFHLDDIQGIVAFQIDLYTYDLVLVKITLNDNRTILISEENDNFMDDVYTFVNRLNEANKNWYFEVIRVPFKENLTVVYKKE